MTNDESGANVPSPSSLGIRHSFVIRHWSFDIRRTLSAALLASLLFIPSPNVAACPFCTPPHSTLSQRRDASDIVALAEWRDSAADGERLAIDAVLKSPADWRRPALLTVPLDPQLRKAGLILALGATEEDDASPRPFKWQLIPVDETSYAYVAKAPSTRLPTHERLPYFCRYLEHADPLVADDVYCEFGLAPYDEVARVAEHLPMASLRRWMTDPHVPEARKGFYALALGLAKGEAERQANAACLLPILERPGAELRAGYDGVIGGYLLLSGEPGLALVESKLLANPDAPLGDVLHALSALRFYWEYGHAISHDRLAQALGHTLDRPEVAARAIVDLARWQAWDLLPQVVRAGKSATGDRQLQRAVIGYLLLCPRAEAVEPLKSWRQQAPKLVAEVEHSLSPASGQ